ncbi:hypothetical protein NDU88_008899 [Pleurodeles waltl]|uniref:Uncharacterized protein n=1 Tax=Pleurodeles waltl TaxID=8319 RepID=A0AAV7QTV2_PLEWA|nr:hypothetical protein NDU88_008899 [Pleurodeles waltl]
MPQLVRGPGMDRDADPALSRADRRSWLPIPASRYGETPHHTPTRLPLGTQHCPEERPRGTTLRHSLGWLCSAPTSWNQGSYGCSLCALFMLPTPLRGQVEARLEDPLLIEGSDPRSAAVHQ